jgi:hypothetical protein
MKKEKNKNNEANKEIVGQVDAILVFQTENWKVADKRGTIKRF